MDNMRLTLHLRNRWKANWIKQGTKVQTEINSRGHSGPLVETGLQEEASNGTVKLKKQKPVSLLACQNDQHANKTLKSSGCSTASESGTRTILGSEPANNLEVSKYVNLAKIKEMYTSWPNSSFSKHQY